MAKKKRVRTIAVTEVIECDYDNEVIRCKARLSGGRPQAITIKTSGLLVHRRQEFKQAMHY